MRVTPSIQPRGLGNAVSSPSAVWVEAQTEIRLAVNMDMHGYIHGYIHAYYAVAPALYLCIIFPCLSFLLFIFSFIYVIESNE